MIRRATVDDVPDINKWVARDAGKEVDFLDFLANNLNICLLSGDGGALFVWRGPRVYEVHVFFEQRGREVLKVSHEMLQYMRDQFDAQLFWAAIPTESRHVIMFTRLMGWQFEGTVDTTNGPCELYSQGTSPCRQQ
jgi:hypothetical protein